MGPSQRSSQKRSLILRLLGDGLLTRAFRAMASKVELLVNKICWVALILVVQLVPEIFSFWVSSGKFLSFFTLVHLNFLIFCDVNFLEKWPNFGLNFLFWAKLGV